MLRRIDAPGIQLNEIDKSQYDSMPDYSIVGTTCFICGFADKGENYSIKWLNTLQTLVDNYGYPQTEEERYFWNACVEVLNAGGICLAAKLPYDNTAKDTFPYVEYQISPLYENNTNGKYSALTTIDNSLTSYIKIYQNRGGSYSGYLPLSTYDSYCVNELNTPLNTIRIVGIDGIQYGITDVATSKSGTVLYDKIECLGTMPVLVGATQALFYQQLLSSNTSIEELSTEQAENAYPYVEEYSLSTIEENIGSKTYVTYATSSDGEAIYLISGEGNSSACVDITAFTNGDYVLTDDAGEAIPLMSVIYYTEDNESKTLSTAYLSSWSNKFGIGSSTEMTENISTYTTVIDINTVQDNKHVSANGFSLDVINFDQQISSETINDYTMSKQAAECYPTIAMAEKDRIDTDQLKLIGVVVFNVMQDPANNQKIMFQLQESFVGSLDKSAKDSDGSSLFIDNIVNSQSKVIRMFSNIDTRKTSWTADRGKLPYAMTTHERASFYAVEPQIGIVLGQYASRCGKHINYQNSIIKALNLIYENAKDTNKWNIDLVVDAGLANIAQVYYTQQNSKYNEDATYDFTGQGLKSLKLINGYSANQNKGWLAVLQKFDNFCKNMRKDCMFIADGLRPFCLDGDQKIVRDTAPQNSIDLDILTKLKWLTGMNTSYGAGYCDWFKGVDAHSGIAMWFPPSIKALGIYIYTDAYWQKWDAPAGMNRGRVQNVVDVAFTPNQDQAGKLYVQCWNYACSYPIDGIVLEGQKTFQRKKTAFDRINVRRLFLTLEKQVARVARYFVYEGNTAWQRERFVDSIREIFENAKQRNGIVDYYIKCDEDNNTPNVIDNNELRCSIAIKPVKTIEFILLNFICTNQSATVSEEIVQ